MSGIECKWEEPFVLPHWASLAFDSAHVTCEVRRLTPALLYDAETSSGCSSLTLCQNFIVSAFPSLSTKFRRQNVQQNTQVIMIPRMIYSLRIFWTLSFVVRKVTRERFIKSSIPMAPIEALIDCTSRWTGVLVNIKISSIVNWYLGFSFSCF